MRQTCLLAAVAAILGWTTMALADPAPPVIACSSSSNSVVVAGGAAAVVDPEISITGGAAIDGVNVLVLNHQTGDVLSYSAGALPAGVTGSWSSATGVLTFSNPADPADWQALLRTVALTVTTTSSAPRRIVFTLGDSLPFADNGHYYAFVAAAAITWSDARDAADALDLFGLQGYLVTVTTPEENAFVVSKLVGQGWMGATDAASESVWRWVTGPEGLENAGAGRHFFTQTSSAAGSPNFAGVYGSTLPGGGVAIGGYYQNWNSSEPNDTGGTGEDYAHFLASGKWNDYPNALGSIAGYVVEYGGMPGDPAVDIEDFRTVDVAHTLTYAATDGGSIGGANPQTIIDGGNGASVTAEPDAGYHFLQWSDGQTTNPRREINVTANQSHTAAFEINIYTLDYSAGPHGTLSGALVQNVTHGDDGASVTATAATGYVFLEWSDGVSANPRRDRSVAGDMEVVAYFATMPTVSTAAIRAITQTSATGGGAVGADGDDEVTVRGVCWSTHAAPTVADARTVDGGGIGGFTSVLSGLSASTEYHVRAYATNRVGTAYGAEWVFRTADPVEQPDDGGDESGGGDDGPDEPSGSPILQIDVVPPDGGVNVGDEVPFQISVSNVGTAAASGTVVRIPLPPGTEFVSAFRADGAGGTPLVARVENGVIIIEIGAVAVSGSVAIELTLRAESSGAIDISAGATSEEITDPATGGSDGGVDVDDRTVEIVTTSRPVNACGAVGMIPIAWMLGFAGWKWRRTVRS